MDFGAAMFFTDYSMTPVELGQALEARGFESVWAPEHSHIPSTRKTPPASGGELEKRYYDVMDPFVTLTAAAMATKTLKVAPEYASSFSATRSRPQNWSRRSTMSRVAGFCSGWAAGGTRTRSRITAPSSKPASRRCASRSKR